MGLFKKKEKKKIELPQNGHWVLVCKECGERLPVPAHTEMPGLVFDFYPETAALQAKYYAQDTGQYTLQLDGLKNFFEVDAEEAGGIVLAASFRDNLKMIHRHIASHHDKFYAMYLQSNDYFKLTYTKGFVPGGLTYENNTLKQFDQLCEIARNPKPGMLDLDKAEIPGYTWALTEVESI